MEHKVGEVFEFDGVKLRVETSDYPWICGDCFFVECEIQCCTVDEIGECIDICRTDKTNVKFIKVKEDDKTCR